MSHGARNRAKSSVRVRQEEILFQHSPITQLRVHLHHFLLPAFCRKSIILILIKMVSHSHHHHHRASQLSSLSTTLHRYKPTFRNKTKKTTNPTVAVLLGHRHWSNKIYSSPFFFSFSSSSFSESVYKLVICT